MSEKEELQLMLSQSAIDYIQEFGCPVANYQFVGYLFVIDYKEKIGCAASINGDWGIYSFKTDRKGNIKPLKERKTLQCIERLLRIGFLIDVKQIPFPEFENFKELSIDASKIQYFEGKLFDECDQRV